MPDVDLFAWAKISIKDVRVEIPSSIYFVPNNHIPILRDIHDVKRTIPHNVI